jgi:hypothetical protein
MSYGYQDPHYDDYSYEYVDDGNHGDNGYNEYELYSDYTEPDHWEPEPTPFELNYHDHNNATDPTEYNHRTNYVYDADNANREDDETYQPQWSKYEGDETNEHGELAHGNNGTGEDWEEGYGRDVEGYEHRGLEYEGNGVHELQELKYAGNEVYELQELKHGEREVRELRELANHEDEAQELRELVLMYDKWGHEPPASLYNEHGDTSGPTYAHTPATPSLPCSPAYDDDDRYAPTPTNPHSHPPCPLPFTCSPTCPSLDASKSCDHVEPEDRTRAPFLYSNLDELRHNYNIGVPSAIAYMQGLQEYTEECLREQEEWKADKRAEIRQNHWIKYPKRDFYTTPRSWDPANRQSVPRTIEQSRPFYPTLKRRHYKNHRAKRYPNPRSRSPPPEPEQQHHSEDSDITLHTSSPPTTLSNKHHSYNNSPKPMYHTNPLSTPYSPA